MVESGRKGTRIAHWGVGLALALALVVFGLPGALAQTGFGAVLQPDTLETVPTATVPTTNPSICYVDQGGSSPPRWNDGDPVYFVFAASCPANLPAGSVRLVAVGGLAAGTPVAGTDPDVNRVIHKPEGTRFSFHDANGDSRFNAGDTAYLALCNPGQCPVPTRVESGWIRMSTSGDRQAGLYVQSGDGDLNRATAQGAGTYFANPVIGHFLFWDQAGDQTFRAGDVLYWRTSGVGNQPAVNWIRLSPLAGSGGFGEVLALGHPDAVPTLTTFQTSVSVCYVDASVEIPPRYDAGEPAYLVAEATCPEKLPTNSLRLNPAGGRPGGTLVEPNDPDAGNLLATPGGVRFSFRDANGDGRFNEGDVAYLAVSNLGQQAGSSVAAGWIRMSSTALYPAGTVVQGGDGDAGRATTQGSGTYFSSPHTNAHFLFWDLMTDNTYHNQDVLYWRTGGVGSNPSVGWIRLGTFPGSAPYGEILRPGNADAVALLSTFLTNVAVCSTDASGASSPRYDPGDPVYLVFSAVCPANLAGGNALRLVPAAGHPGGTYVRAVDSDSNAALHTPGGLRFAFRDANGDQRFNAGDTAYLALCNLGQCPAGSSVAPGWIRMSMDGTTSGATLVQAGDADAGRTTITGPGTYFTTPNLNGHFLFWDIAGDGGIGPDDIIYWRTGNVGLNPLPNWIRLGAALAAIDRPIDDDEPDEEDPVTRPREEPEIIREDENGTPGPLAVLVVALVVAGLGWVRRRGR